jgi:uncharacterized membrane protein
MSMAIQQSRQGNGASHASRAGSGLRSGDRYGSGPWPRDGDRSHDRDGDHGGKEARLASCLGWFSLGLGIAQVLAPGEVARWIGVTDDDDSRAVMRTVGMREIASGVGILTRPRPAGWLWTRVAGDFMDLALLGRARNSEAFDSDRLAATTAAVAGITLVDLLASEQLSRHAGGAMPGAAAEQGLGLTKTMTINRPAEELYRFWRDFENLPKFMRHLEAVQVTGERRSHWKAKAPLGMTVEWDAEVTEDIPNQQISWRSLPGADVDNAGTVRFQRAPHDWGTEVRVEMSYRPPGGVIGDKIAHLFGEGPRQQVRDDLRRFKQLMETGEIVLSEGTLPGQRAAQPPPEWPPRA